MKKVICLLVMCLLLPLFGCSCKKEDDNKIKYTHYVRGGGAEELDATILWEFSTEAYTKYQVAYTSYVCSDPSVNYMNVIYLELTTKKTKNESTIREISFTTTTGPNNVTFNVGMWGDYKEALNKEYYSGIESQLVAKLKHSTYEMVTDIASYGYKNYQNIDGINKDAISGGTISASNVVSIVKAIFDYHINKYY